jgi:pectate lyase
MVDVKDVYDISIIGVGSDATITGFGLNITRSKNIIVRNIKFASWSDDAISVDANDDVNKGNHIWIDHCTFTYTPPAGYPAASGPDGSVDITHTATFVTVSYCFFDSTDKNSLVGHSNSNVVDTAMRITYHHNWFKNSAQRNPRVRFCKVHVFNNYYTNNSIYGVSSNLEADVLVEGNYFYNTPIPTETSRDGSPPGDLVERYNIFVDCGVPGTRGNAFEASDYYYYTLDSAYDIPQIVPALAGSGKYDFSNPNYIIPVELVSFTASANGTNALLQWITATELNNHGFEIERIDRISGWTNIAFIPGEGTSTERREYSYSDRNLLPGRYEYRLKQIDYDGKFTYSTVVSVDIELTPRQFALAQNYPNPFNPITTISFSIGEPVLVSLKIYDVLGNEVKTLVNENMMPGNYSKSFSAEKYTSGIYYYRLTAGSFSATNKMVLLK